MPISLNSVRMASAAKPPMQLCYGTSGVGKTTFAAQAPSPIFIQTEDGLSGLDVPTFGVLATLPEVLEAIDSLTNEEHDLKTLCIDSADHLEPLIWAETMQANGWKGDIASVPYGRGYVAAVDQWRHLIGKLRKLRDTRDMGVILIAHSQVRRFESPEHEPYDRYMPKLHKDASALVQESMDCVLFANYRIHTSKSDAGFNKKIVRGMGNGERVLHAEERPAYVAKQRYNLPPSFPMLWDELAAGIPYYAQHIPAAAQ